MHRGINEAQRLSYKRQLGNLLSASDVPAQHGRNTRVLILLLSRGVRWGGGDSRNPAVHTTFLSLTKYVTVGFISHGANLEMKRSRMKRRCWNLASETSERFVEPVEIESDYR